MMPLEREMMTLEDMVKLAEDQARRVMIGTKRELTPMWLLVTAKGDVEVFATPWGNNREKRLVIETMRDVMREKRATAYSMLTEAWMLRVQGVGITEENYTGPMPSESPDRQECIVVMAANRDGEHRYQTMETVRAADGTCAEFRSVSKPEDQFTGIFDNLLDDRKRAS
jgi:hypothetical protein